VSRFDNKVSSENGGFALKDLGNVLVRKGILDSVSCESDGRTGV
jgi:hypothetical protein